MSAKDYLPAKAFYKRKKRGRRRGGEEDRLRQFKTFAGVTVPFIIDHFRRSEQTSRINYDSIEFNSPIADALFAKPANIKALK